MNFNKHHEDSSWEKETYHPGVAVYGQYDGTGPGPAQVPPTPAPTVPGAEFEYHPIGTVELLKAEIARLRNECEDAHAYIQAHDKALKEAKAEIDAAKALLRDLYTETGSGEGLPKSLTLRARAAIGEEV